MTRHRPTRRVALVGGFAVVLVYLLSLTGNPWFLPMVGATVGVLVASLLSRARIDDLAVEIALPPTSTLGDDVGGVLTITNRGGRPSSELSLVVRTQGLSDLDVHVGRLDPSTQVAVAITRTATVRGLTDHSAVFLVASPSLGLVQATRHLVLESPVRVHPRLHPVPRPPLNRRAGTDATDGTVARASGVELAGVREWRPGDDRSRVHWRSTARSGRPILLERGEVVATELRVALVGVDTSPGFESALATAASLCDVAMRAGQPVTVVAWHVDGPVLGADGSRAALLEWWCTVRHTVLPDPQAFARTALAGFGPGDVVVVGPPEMSPEWFAVACRAASGMSLHRLQDPA